MVARNIHHDHDGNRCPGCRFRQVLGEALEQAHEDGRQEWHWTVGKLRQRMHAALLALDAIESQALGDDDADEEADPAADAAAAISAVGLEIQHLWTVLMDHDGQGKDPSAGL
jgi:hypothetical protein